MKYTILSLLLWPLLAATAQPGNEPLFQVFVNGKYGFINSDGKQVIQPEFVSVLPFSEGLAPARTGGTYGYIDNTGQYVIAPQFDYALPFSEGLAVVWLQGKPQVINKKGEQAFETDFAAIGSFNCGSATVITDSRAYGCINRQGGFILDTVYSDISNFENGYAIVTSLNHRPRANTETGEPANWQVGIVDTTGTFVVKYGEYEDISEPYMGYFEVESTHGKKWIQKTIYIGPDRKITTVKVSDNFKLSTRNLPVNRFFICNTETYIMQLANAQGKLISNKKFERVVNEEFTEGYAFVQQKDELYGMIDTNGNWVIKPKYEEVHSIGVAGGYFFFKDYPEGYNEDAETDEEDDYDDGMRYGIARTDGSVVLKPCMEQISYEGFVDGLLLCLINKKQAYVNTQGKIVWEQQAQQTTALKPLDLDCMNRGYFYAYSERDTDDIGGFGRSGNYPHKVTAENSFKANTLAVEVMPNAVDTFYNTYYAHRVYLYNTTGAAVKFNAQDSRLYMKVQALNTNGTWQDIEYLPSSWCGNSYHTLTLNTGNYWQFVTPQYTGSYKTKLRIELKYLLEKAGEENNWKGKEQTVYSNEYEGNINPAQFWRKETYYPNGIMDPYND